jgi:hypothetical protein
MGLLSLKEVIDNVGYYIPYNQRVLFTSEESIQTTFGFGPETYLQFSMYDINGTPIQLSSGEFYRHIPLTSENIGKYLLISTTSLENSRFSEYFVDIKKLLNEAGYSIGTFRTRVVIVSRRVGKYDTTQALWISEISPSRTEIRLRPSRAGGSFDEDTIERFRIFLSSTDDLFTTKLFTQDISEHMRTYLASMVSDTIDDTDTILSHIMSKFNLSSDKLSDINVQLIREVNTEVSSFIESKIGVTLDEIHNIVNVVATRVVSRFF